jgi:1-acyl-sn-glycerol-3-phosphate acyltransferase
VQQCGDARVVIANHTAFFDGLFVFSFFTPVVIAADFVRKLPIFGTLLTAAQAIFVNRDDKGEKNFVLNEMKRRVETPGFNPILIFPEGTTTSNSILGKSFEPLSVLNSAFKLYSSEGHSQLEFLSNR